MMDLQEVDAVEIVKLFVGHGIQVRGEETEHYPKLGRNEGFVGTARRFSSSTCA